MIGLVRARKTPVWRIVAVQRQQIWCAVPLQVFSQACPGDILPLDQALVHRLERSRRQADNCLPALTSRSAKMYVSPFPPRPGVSVNPCG